jgi:hypothetical protein
MLPGVRDEGGRAEPVDGAIDVDDRQHAIVREQRSRQPEWAVSATRCTCAFADMPAVESIGRHRRMNIATSRARPSFKAS